MVVKTQDPRQPACSTLVEAVWHHLDPGYELGMPDLDNFHKEKVGLFDLLRGA